jgi:serine/threonine protein kinase
MYLSVHDGRAFAMSMRAGIARVPLERALLASDSNDTAGLMARWAATWVRRDCFKESQLLTWRSRVEAPRISHRPRSPSRYKPPPAAASTSLARVLTVEELAARPSAAAFSDFKVISQLGLGQFASVYHAVHLPTGAEVALKICSRPIQPPPPGGDAAASPAVEIDPMDVDCFSLEASVLLELSCATESARDSAAEASNTKTSLVAGYHPTYRVHGLAQLDSRGSRGWIAMEFLKGHTLLRHLRPELDSPPGAASPRASPRRVSLREVIFLMRDVALELEQLHELGVIHRDLKETNIIVSPPTTPDGRPAARLIDYGLALSFEPPIDRLRTAYQLQQRVGVYGYMPPEVFRCEPYGRGVDIFAFGVLLYRSLKVALPRPKSVQVSTWAAQLPFKVARTSYSSYCAPRVSPAWPKELSYIITRCCAADQEKRPPMPLVLRELDAWLADAEMVRGGKR